MTAEKTNIEGVLLIKARVFEDQRGYFMESFNRKAFQEATGIDQEFVQDNESVSSKGVLRGIHFQEPPMAQAKLIRVNRGAVLDVVVDIRKDSPTYGEHFAMRIDDQNKWQLYLPEGMGHGFLTLEDNTCFVYKCSNYYSPEHDRTILWNDSDLAIDWGISNPEISDKDQQGVPFQQLNSPFTIVNSPA